MVRGALLRTWLVASIPTLVLAAVPSQSDTTAIQNAFVTNESPLAASMPTIPLSDAGMDVFAVGGGKTDLGMQQFSLSAHASPKGDFGQWSVKVTSPTGMLVVRYTVDVDCVHGHAGFFGNAAVIKGVVEKVEPVPNVLAVMQGQTVLLGVKDGGEGGGFPVDDFFAPHDDPFPAASCKLIFYGSNFNNVTSGNVNIKIN